ncbi:MAG: S9 family peptidase [Elusimicrobia bacterium]|nr:S9 family peptidase [Elusimicrobiota bacterium]
MIRTLLLLVLALPAAAQKDPYLWLETPRSPRALEWVRAQDSATLSALTSDPRYEAVHAQALRLLEAKDKIPYVTRRGDWLYNFWRDKEHPRGLWRRATLAEYRKADPAWETILDVDALDKAEKVDWVFAGASCLPPEGRLCMVGLSRGGRDATQYREFDTDAKAFVAKGFFLKDAKSDVSWLDQDDLLVGTDFGPGSLTSSGYPREIRLWRRGEPLSRARLLLEAPKSDVSADEMVFVRPEGTTAFVSRDPSFFKSLLWLLDGGRKVRVPLPDDASPQGVFRGRLLARLRSEWRRGKEDYPAGSLVAMDLADVRAGRRPRVAAVWVPDERSSLAGVATTKDAVLLAVMRDVRTGLWSAVPDAKGRWTLAALPAPTDGTAFVSDADDFHDDFFYGYEDFLTPPSLDRLAPGAAPERLKSLPPRFDASRFVVEQRFAKAPDGTAIPFFLVHATGAVADSANPTLLYGYGGFEISMRPSYMDMLGPLWLERGGSYALADIRGGGEYGPRWHDAALKEKRPVAFDDFAAVAEALIASKFTSPRRLGIMGGSNGGLLVGATMVRRPELFHAVVCQVPLLDMIRYPKIAAGASWEAEYGNPADPKMRAEILQWSPYQNVRPASERAYPQVFFETSTADDRVGPAHARKMAAKMEALGHKVYFYEDTEGGHTEDADLKERALFKSLETVYLLEKLAD